MNECVHKYILDIDRWMSVTENGNGETCPEYPILSKTIILTPQKGSLMNLSEEESRVIRKST